MKNIAFLMTILACGTLTAAETIHSDAWNINDWEKFDIVDRTGWYYDFNLGYTVKKVNIMTKSGYYLTAVEGGDKTCDVTHTDLYRNSTPNTWEEFRLINLGNGDYGLLTVNNYWVTVNGGGGRSCKVLYTNRPFSSGYTNWEKFKLVTVQEGLGPVYRYYTAFQTYTGNYLTAFGGGGRGYYSCSWTCW